jgi:6-phosphofructokinase 2
MGHSARPSVHDRQHHQAVLTVTLNPSVDLSTGIPTVEPDRKMRCHGLTVEAGGGGVNVARVARRQGAVATAAVLVGGPFGEQLLELLAAEGVPAVPIRIRGNTRQNFTAIEAATSRQYRFVLPGPVVGEVEFADACEQIAALAAPESHIVISGSLPVGVGNAAFGELLWRLRANGAALIVDTSDEALGVAASVGTVLLKPSVRELSVFAGESLETQVDIEAAARDLLARGPNRAVVVSLGAAGALLVRPRATTKWIHAPSVRVASTIGAGDSLVAAMAVAVERGDSMETAARRGVAAGTAATLAIGTSLCSAENIDRMLPLVSVSDIP